MVVDGGYDITVDHNTVLQDGWTSLYFNSPVRNFVFTNNILPDYSWAVMGAGAAPGSATINSLLPGSTFLGNIIAGANPATYPTGNFYPASMAGVGFVNYAPLTGGNYRLAPTSIYRLGGIDGKDPGADIDVLNAKTNSAY